jgi:succinylglutamic semialdehyde dehydrogenase
MTYLQPNTLESHLIIRGKESGGEGAFGFSVDPVEEVMLWWGHYASPAQVDAAFVSARLGFKLWSRTSLEGRITVARNYAKLLQEHRDPLAVLISAEMGKPVWEALTEVATAIAKVEVSIQAIESRRWTRVERVDGQSAVTRYKPLGVMLVLGPYNFPLHLPGSHIVPALLAGNSIVFKPSEQTPAVGQYLAQLWQAAGLPEGVFNLIHGRGDIAAYAVAHPELNGVLFTGSYRTGVAIHRSLAGQPEKLIALEMGGINPLVVLPTAEPQIGAQVYTIIQSAFITSGQRCSCARRLILPRGDFGEELLDRLKLAVQSVTIGKPRNEVQPFMGSVVHRFAAEQLLKTQAAWLESGAQALVKMEAIDHHPTILKPGLIETTGCNLPDEEWFGPLLRVEWAENLEHSIELANATAYGLAASLLGGTMDDFEFFVQGVQAGVVNWNRQTTGASGRLPFGGVGKSGNHRPSAFFAADYTSYPVASLEDTGLVMPSAAAVGLQELYRICSEK